MRLVEYNVFRRDTRNASGKAKYDASDILAGMGFRRLYEPSGKRPLRVLQQAVHIMGISADSVVAVQYPGNKAQFYKMLKSRGARTIALIHDIEALRDGAAAGRESEVLGLFDCLITHNASMSEAVRGMGYRGSLVELGLFDYLSNGEEPPTSRDRGEVAFAGNFEKAAFARDLGAIGGLRFNLYGIPEPSWAADVENVDYRGSFPSEEIASRIEGAWGLVWDGESVETCSGSLGGYLRYNCPHKASMYVVSGRPLIVWAGSAIAPIVHGEGIGIAVDSLGDAPDAVSGVGDAEYAEMLGNVRRVRGELVSGSHLRAAMGKALEMVG